MHLKAVYAAGGGIVVFVVVILVINNTGTHTITSTNGRQGTNNTAMPITLSIKSIAPNKISNHLANIHISFNATNPNSGTAILEAIQYSIKVDDKLVASGTIGERLERFLASSAGVYPIVGGGSVILKDNQLFQKNNSTIMTWNKVVEGKANYVVTGTMSYRQISGLEGTSTDKDFKLVFP